MRNSSGIVTLLRLSPPLIFPFTSPLSRPPLATFLRNPPVFQLTTSGKTSIHSSFFLKYTPTSSAAVLSSDDGLAEAGGGPLVFEIELGCPFPTIAARILSETPSF